MTQYESDSEAFRSPHWHKVSFTKTSRDCKTKNANSKKTSYKLALPLMPDVCEEESDKSGMQTSTRKTTTSTTLQVAQPTLVLRRCSEAIVL